MVVACLFTYPTPPYRLTDIQYVFCSGALLTLLVPKATTSCLCCHEGDIVRCFSTFSKKKINRDSEET